MLNRVYLHVLDFSERAFRCYRAAGLVEEGRLRSSSFVRGQFHDVIVMSILEDEYRQRRANR